jgi:hypothetical protein
MDMVVDRAGPVDIVQQHLVLHILGAAILVNADADRLAVGQLVAIL